jgi:hypothetical protein
MKRQDHNETTVKDLLLRKSSNSGASNYVEGAFRTSSFSAGTNCVEVSGCDCSEVRVRDSKDPAKRTLTFTRGEWAAFVKGVKNNEFDV